MVCKLVDLLSFNVIGARGRQQALKASRVSASRNCVAKFRDSHLSDMNTRHHLSEDNCSPRYSRGRHTAIRAADGRYFWLTARRHRILHQPTSVILLQRPLQG
ncbi:hypothetical protein AVEN_3602-1 [Araneus ventricosus]|uniref:Uncharacterized protein n=1 Tax=Araneus ventricosus TaxID=182803 RepID=A0A4Y2FNS1_ARAVE|nr:hypothetical protein AVEN_3602-1 [Araneus ventricosus]